MSKIHRDLWTRRIVLKAEIDRRAANFLKGALRNLRLEMRANELSEKRAEVEFMFLRPTLLQKEKVEWTIQRFRLNSISHREIKKGEILGSFAELRRSYLTKCPLQEVVEDLVGKGLRAPNISICLLLRSNIFALNTEIIPHESNRVNVTTWPAKRDYIRLLDN